MNKPATHRYENLDYLRGLCALSIMAYHYIGWTIGGQDAGTFLGKLGVYGVSMFYVLSGLTMYLVYFKNFRLSTTFFQNFYVKRLFRIYPLMWLIMVLAIIAYGTKLSLTELTVNFTGLFSIVDWDASVPVGVWSIGNELSFYLMLPIFFYCLKRGAFPTLLISAVTFGVYFWFAFVLFDKSKPIGEQDSYYKHPLNQAALFLEGILIGHLFKTKSFNNGLLFTFLLAALLAFYFYPVDGDAINIVAGIERLIFTFLCFVFTFVFFKAHLFFVPAFCKKSLSWLGEISYSLYLVHPHVFTLLALTGLKIRFVFPLAVIVTFFASWLIYRVLESPARNLGLKMIKKPALKPETKS